LLFAIFVDHKNGCPILRGPRGQVFVRGVDLSFARVGYREPFAHPFPALFWEPGGSRGLQAPEQDFKATRALALVGTVVHSLGMRGHVFEGVERGCTGQHFEHATPENCDHFSAGAAFLCSTNVCA